MQSSLDLFHPHIRTWFRAVFQKTTKAQELGWPSIERGDHTLIFAPTGSGKTLAAFLSAIHHIMFSPLPARNQRCRVIYISPLKALAADVEKNLQVPITGILNTARPDPDSVVVPSIFLRTGD